MSLADHHWREDPLRATAMRQGSSGSGIGWRSHRIIRRRARWALFDSATAWAAAVAGLAIAASIIGRFL